MMPLRLPACKRRPRSRQCQRTGSFSTGPGLAQPRQDAQGVSVVERAQADEAVADQLLHGHFVAQRGVVPQALEQVGQLLGGEVAVQKSCSVLMRVCYQRRSRACASKGRAPLATASRARKMWDLTVLTRCPSAAAIDL